MSDVTECPFCRTKVVITSANRCPACQGDVTDQEALRRSERIDQAYGLIWDQHQAGKSLRDAVTAVETDSLMARADIDAARAAFLEEGRRKFLERGKWQLAIGFVLLVGGISFTGLQFLMPLPVVFVAWGAIAFGAVALVFGGYDVLKYWYYFRR